MSESGFQPNLPGAATSKTVYLMRAGQIDESDGQLTAESEERITAQTLNFVQLSYHVTAYGTIPTRAARLTLAAFLNRYEPSRTPQDLGEFPALDSTGIATAEWHMLASKHGSFSAFLRVYTGEERSRLGQPLTSGIWKVFARLQPGEGALIVLDSPGIELIAASFIIVVKDEIQTCQPAEVVILTGDGDAGGGRDMYSLQTKLPKVVVPEIRPAA